MKIKVIDLLSQLNLKIDVSTMEDITYRTIDSYKILDKDFLEVIKDNEIYRVKAHEHKLSKDVWVYTVSKKIGDTFKEIHAKEYPDAIGWIGCVMVYNKLINAQI